MSLFGRGGGAVCLKNMPGGYAPVADDAMPHAWTGCWVRAGEVAKANLEPSNIRRSVESDGWDPRAGQLLPWLSEEDRS